MQTIEIYLGDELCLYTNLVGHPALVFPKKFEKDHGFVAGKLHHQALRQVGAVEHLDGRSIDRWGGHDCDLPHFNLAAAAGFPPVRSGDRMKTTGLCVVKACLIDLSTIKGIVASSVSV